jgi:hypothetical protein
VDEMELRIETQKQTLCARDESMRKLLEMLQSKGLSVQKIEDNQQEVEHLQTRQLEDDRKIKQLQNTLSQKESDITKLKEVRCKNYHIYYCLYPKLNHTCIYILYNCGNWEICTHQKGYCLYLKQS